MKSFVIVSTCFFFLVSTASAQNSERQGVAALISTANQNNNELGIEKLYLHTDKSIYGLGDTLWFKAYLFDATYFAASEKSGIMYMEVIDDSNRVVKRNMLPVFLGIAFGQLPLTEKDFSGGNYTLIAYTSWMRNFGAPYIFKKQFYVSGDPGKEWLINYNASLTTDPADRQVNLKLHFSTIDKKPAGSRQFRIAVSDTRRNIFRETVTTYADGSATVPFNYSGKDPIKTLTLTVQDVKNDDRNFKQFVPLILNRPEDIDLQFMPEGGSMVANIPSRVGFKALDESGFGTPVSGKIVDGTGKQVAVFSSLHKGMGSFEILPAEGQTYAAVVAFPDGNTKRFPLPEVHTSGIVLSVHNDLQSDSCEVVIQASSDLVSGRHSYFLTAQARNLLCFGAALKAGKKVEKFKISKKTFPTGIVRFAISDADHRTINQRIVFINHQDNLDIKITTDKSSYKQRDSVRLLISASDAAGNPIQGSFSLAVTDNSQVKTDSISSHSIVSRLLLTSDLKGHVEDPGYYFRLPVDTAQWKHLDLLLLTQGWVGYEWKDFIDSSMKPEFAAEHEFLIKGQVTNMFNKPVAGSGVVMMSHSPVMLFDTSTNERGIFTFRGTIPADTSVYFIQSRNRKNKSFNVGIEMDEFRPPVFATSPARMIPWYVNTDPATLTFVHKQAQLKKEYEEVTGVKTLAEVIVTSKRRIKGSRNLNGPGEADVIISEEELEQAGRKTLGMLLEERVKGFGLRTTKTGMRVYRIDDKLVHLIIDGIETEFFMPEGVSLYDFLKPYFDYYDAEEIKGIEVMTSGKYQMRYTSTFLDPLAVPWDHAFIEVTTRGGKGPFMKKAVGTYLYRPMPFILPRKFYVPKYEAASKPDMSDIRSTVYWEPNVITGKDGKAAVYFSTTDNPGTYTWIIEGSDMQGGIGASRGTIAVVR